jgi:HNH endonuclease/Homing endonuclease associated repeat
LIAAGLKPVKRSRVRPDEITEDLQRVARILKVRTFTRDQYLIHGKYGSSIVVRLFETWNNALQVAGLESRRTSPTTAVTDLFDNLEMLWRKLGRPPRGSEVRKPLSRFNIRSYTNRFGTVRDALKAFVRFKKTTGGKEFSNINIPSHQPPVIHKTPRIPSWKLRFKILSRDRFRCCACGRSPSHDADIKLHVDHKIPWSRGGETVEKNLQTLCDQCNGGKSDMPL